MPTTTTASIAPHISTSISSVLSNCDSSALSFDAKAACWSHKILELGNSQQRIDGWLIGFTILIAVGLFFEFRTDIREFRIKRRHERSGLGPNEIEETSRDVLFTLFGAFLVLVGVVGEFWEEGQTMQVQGGLDSANRAQSDLLKTEADAADAKISAANQTAKKAIDAEGGLDKYVHDHTQKIQDDIHDLETAKKNADAALKKIPPLEKQAEILRGNLRGDEKQLNDNKATIAAATKEQEDFIDAVTPRGFGEVNHPRMALQPKAGVKTFFTIGEGWDSSNLANQIVTILKAATWEVAPVLPDDKRTWRSGVTVVYRTNSDSGFAGINPRAREAAMALCEQLNAQDIFATIWPAWDSSDWNNAVPKDALLIRVGKNPSVYFSRRGFKKAGVPTEGLAELKDVVRPSERCGQ